MSNKLTLKNWKLTNREKAFAEHYIYGLAAAGWATEKIVGSHDYKKIAVGALVGGILAPLVARINPLSLANSISNETGVPVAVAQSAVQVAVKEADKVIAQQPAVTAIAATAPAAPAAVITPVAPEVPNIQ